MVSAQASLVKRVHQRHGWQERNVTSNGKHRYNSGISMQVRTMLDAKEYILRNVKNEGKFVYNEVSNRQES